MKDKTGQGSYCQILNNSFTQLTQSKVSAYSKTLYFYLNHLENRLQQKGNDWFYRSIKNLSEDTGISTREINRSLIELRENGFISTHLSWIKRKGIILKKRITVFTILR